MSVLFNLLIVASLLVQSAGVFASSGSSSSSQQTRGTDVQSLLPNPSTSEVTHSSDQGESQVAEMEQMYQLHSTPSTLPPPPIDDSSPVPFSLNIDSEIVTLGDVLTFTVTITNDTDDALYGLVYEDVLEDGLNFVKGEDDVVTFDPTTKTISYELPFMEVGVTVDFNYSVRVIGTLPQDRPWGELWIH